MRVDLCEINKTPLKIIGERCINSLFINHNKKKPYTKICYKTYIPNYNMNKCVQYFTNLHVPRYNQK